MTRVCAAADSGAAPGTRLLGVDFSSAPSARKPITAAWMRWSAGRTAGPVLCLESLEALPTLQDFDALLHRPGPWVGGFDLPLGLPRELVLALGWPTDWPQLIHHYGALPREQIRACFRAFCAARPPGAKFAHRATDRPAGSSSSMKWVNPPVAWMLHAGAPRLLGAGVHLPGLRAGDPDRVALEAYPALLARAVTRASYKSDDRRLADPERRRARAQIVRALEAGSHAWGISVRMAPEHRRRILDDFRGDWLDALLCAVVAGWAHRQGADFGVPAAVDPIEGWIVGVPGARG